MSRRGVWVTNHLVNHITRPLLRGSLGRRFGSHLALLRVRGRRSGTAYEVPVQYARDGDAVWILPGDPEHKRWWRNLRGRGNHLDITIAGVEHHGHGIALEGREHPDEVASGLGIYLEQLPRARRSLGLPPVPTASEADDVSTIAKELVLVRVDLAAA